MLADLRFRLLAAVIMAFAFATSAAAEDIALTFDDLPALGLTDSAPYAQVTTRRLLAGLRRHHLPATGFVIGDKLEGPDRKANIAILNRWLDAGMDLGNHSYSHESLTRTPVDAYIADVGQADAAIRPVLAARHRTPRWFRHPYLETGPTPEARHAFEAWLAAHGYRVAPGTVENADWMFALPYDDAVLHGDAKAAAHVREAYLAYTAQVVAWYRAAAVQLLGRRPALVFVLHATRLNADTIDQLADILKRNDLRAVSLDRAMRDPAYKIPDDYAGPDGDEWISRWARTLGKELPWDDFPEPPADIAAANARLDVNP